MPYVPRNGVPSSDVPHTIIIRPENLPTCRIAPTLYRLIDRSVRALCSGIAWSKHTARCIYQCKILHLQLKIEIPLFIHHQQQLKKRRYLTLQLISVFITPHPSVAFMLRVVARSEGQAPMNAQETTDLAINLPSLGWLPESASRSRYAPVLSTFTFAAGETNYYSRSTTGSRSIGAFTSAPDAFGFYARETRSILNI